MSYRQELDPEFVYKNTKGAVSNIHESIKNKDVEVMKTFTSYREELAQGRTEDELVTPLITCVIENSYDCMKTLLELGTDVNGQSKPHGYTAVYYACCLGDTKMVKTLIKNKADVSLRDVTIKLAQRSDIDLLGILIKAGVNLKTLTLPEGFESVEECILANIATRERNLELLQLLKSGWARLEPAGPRDPAVATPLGIAVESGYEEVVEYLLSCEVSVKGLTDEEIMPNFQKRPRYDPAGYATRERIALMLVEAGVDVEREIEPGMNLKLQSALIGRPALLRQMAANGVDLSAPVVDKSSFFQKSPLHYAKLNNVDYEDEPDDDEEGWAEELDKFKADKKESVLFLQGLVERPIHAACQKDDVAKLKNYIEEDIDAPGDLGETPIMICAKLNKNKCFAALMEARADIFAKDHTGLTAVSHAALNSNYVALEKLVASGADIRHVGLRPEHFDSNESENVYAVIRSGDEVLFPGDAEVGEFDLFWLAYTGMRRKKKASAQALECVKYAMEILGIPKNEKELADSKEFKAIAKPQPKELFDHWADGQIHTACDENDAKMVMDFIYDKERRGKGGKTPMMAASARGSLSCLKVLVENGADVNRPAPNGQTPLHWASQKGHLESIKFLLANGANLTQTDRKRKSAIAFARAGKHDHIVDYFDGLTFGFIHKACETDNVTEVRKLIAEKDRKGKEGRTPVMTCVLNGNIDSLRALVDSGADLTKSDNHGTTALQYAEAGDFPEVLGFLEEVIFGLIHKLCEKNQVGELKKVMKDKDRRGRQSRTPAMTCVLNNSMESLEFLVGVAGADLSMIDIHGMSALQYAQQGTNDEMLDYLETIVYGPIHKACETNDLEMVEKEIKDMNRRGKESRTPLISAVLANNLDCVKYLVEKGADYNSSDNSGLNALQHAIKMDVSEEMVDYLETVFYGEIHKACERNDMELLERNIKDKERRGKDRRTPIITCAMNGSLECLQFLVEKKADVNRQDKFNQNALYYAQQGKDEATLYYLEEVIYGRIHKLCEKDDAAEVRKLVSETERIGEEGRTPLMTCAQNRSVKALQMLLENAADTNKALKSNGWTAAHFAASIGAVDILRCLVDAGADLTIKNGKNQTPADEALNNGYKDCSRYLKEAMRLGPEERKILTDRRKRELRKRLEEEERRRLEEESKMEEERNERGAEAAEGIDVWSDMQDRLIHQACREGDPGRVKRQLDRMDLPGTHGWTPLIIAAIYGDLKCMKVLVEAGADINKTDTFGRTPAFWAAYNYRRKCLLYLVDHGADLTIEDERGDTVYSFAKSRHRKGCAEYVEGVIKTSAPRRRILMAQKWEQFEQERAKEEEAKREIVLRRVLEEKRRKRLEDQAAQMAMGRPQSARALPTKRKDGKARPKSAKGSGKKWNK